MHGPDFFDWASDAYLAVFMDPDFQDATWHVSIYFSGGAEPFSNSSSAGDGGGAS